MYLLQKKIEIIPVQIQKEINISDDIHQIILDSVYQINEKIHEDDILVIAQKIISKSENRYVNLDEVTISKEAKKLSENIKKDLRLLELILRESTSIIRQRNDLLIVETKNGFVCANAGIDRSNVSKEENIVLLLPKDPDRSAREIQEKIVKKTGKNIGVIISDTFGRPFRNGQVNVAIGIAGINPLKSYIGTKDIFGKTLRVTEIAIADEIASAAELVMEKSNKIPVAIIRGYKFEKDNSNKGISLLLRNKEKDEFRK